MARFGLGNARSLALATLLVLAVGGPAHAISCGGAPADVTAQMVSKVNAARSRAGLRPLAADPKLARAAQGHACDMARRGFFSHNGSGGSTPKVRVKKAGYKTCLTAENISFGWRSVDQVMGDLMHSPKHRDNILRNGVGAIGIGYVPPQGGQGPWWVQVFAKPC